MGNLRIKHLIHCFAFICVITLSINSSLNVETNVIDESIYSWPLRVVLHFLALTPLFQLPFMLSTLLGFLIYDCFPDNNVQLTVNVSKLPKVCFRVVTKGKFTKVILKVLRMNLEAIRNVKLTNLKYEIVTESHIDGLKNDEIVQVDEILVPSDYRTRKGTLFKARNLQYCLEDGVSTLKDNDWVVHLDEDTILTENAVKGIANFVYENKYCFGKGLVDCRATSFIATMLELMPVIEYGQLRFDTRFHHNQYATMFRNVFLVARVDAEKDVTFDVEPGPSMTEDVAFGMLMNLKGYKCGYVEGNVIEQATPSLGDFIKTRIRGMKGFFTLQLVRIFSIEIQGYYPVLD